ncbi:MAG: DUF5012 domain-containing protein [Candidatus Symbiothrix sp.]|nr:DUF5012 domain-containing protein [Candidatus Symbiothrix sp.]
MKKIFYSLFLVCSLIAFAGCHEITSEDPSKITYYVSFELQGDRTMFVKVGDTFTDPGVIATEGDLDVSAGVKITGSVNTGEIGLYNITYSAVNVDGFSASAARTVFVYNPAVTTDVAGAYTVASGTHRLAFSNGAQVAYSGYPVRISKVAPGIFYVSDFFGGYYEVRAGYGANYAMTGYFSLNEDNTIDLLDSHVNGWGDALDDLENASYDPQSGVIEWGAVYAGAYSFNVKLSK